jgi:ATP-dependent Lhr-like helicase
VAVADHVLARQTVDDCLHEGLSVEGLVDMWSRVESGAIEVHAVESSEPSPFSHAILSGRPFTYLDDAPLEERRTRALSLRRGLGALGPDGLPVPADELAALDPEAVAVVLDTVRPRPRDPDELHDLLLSLVAARPVDEWTVFFEALAADGRADLVDGRWAATERSASAAALDDDDDAAAACAAGHLQLAGPVTVEELVATAPLPAGAPMGAPLTAARARTALARLEVTGSAIELPDGRWCARHLLVRCTAPAAAVAAAPSRPSRSRPSCGSWSAGSTRWRISASRGAPGCWRSSSSCRGSRRRPPSGRPRSSRHACGTTTPAGWTSSASRARWCGAA